MMADWRLPCSIRRPIPPSRPAMLCRIGPLSSGAQAQGSPNSCSGRYTQRYPNSCYSYSQFCDRYKSVSVAKALHAPDPQGGEKLFIDYCGPTVPIASPSTGEVRRAQVFVAVLGASNYTFAEAPRSQSLPDWLQSHVRAFEIFGGTPVLLIPTTSKRCQQALPIRSRAQPQLPAVGRALSGGGDASSPLQA